MNPETLRSIDRVFRLLASILVVSLAGCTVDIHHDLEEIEADEIIVLLETHGIAAQKERERRGGWSISVPADDAGRSFRLMHTYGLPPREIEGWGAILDDSSLVRGPAEERARFLLATAGALESTLRSIPGIVDARVHLALPLGATNPFEGPVNDTQGGSVFLLHEAGFDGSVIEVSEIQSFVASSVEGLQREDVFVVFVPWEPGLDHENSGELARLGPFGVTRASHRPLQMILVVMCGLVLFLGGLVAIHLRQSRTN